MAVILISTAQGTKEVIEMETIMDPLSPEEMNESEEEINSI